MHLNDVLILTQKVFSYLAILSYLANFQVLSLATSGNIAQYEDDQS